MIEPQPITTVNRSELAAKASEFSREGRRLVQICCTTGEKDLEVTYSFDKDYAFSNLRVILPRSDAVIPSITGSYLAAFTYENELQDLFGIKVTDLAINYNGKFYITAVKHPFLQKKTT
ncbi:MAG: NADH-quinone oxidoreductase subunit C [Chitinispirillaceae bacterium]|nr:NADH-quinone oxidoreductase subunit C [Chitinispirillaceae bacterium]